MYSLQQDYECPGYKIFPVWKLGCDKKIHRMDYEFTIT